jgi:hypothetical protein
VSPCYDAVQKILSPDLDPSIAASSGVEVAFTEDPFPAVGTKVGSVIIFFGDVAPEDGIRSTGSVGSIVGTKDKKLVPLLLGAISRSVGA